MPTENLIPKKQYRYPGATPFDIGQEHIFFGRKQDTHDLYRLIQREALVVLYGKSGLGKSSLLNAGIVPACLREGTYAPLVIRFGAWTEGKTETPLSTTKAMLTTGFQKDTFLKTLLPEEDSLWYHAKNRQLNGGGRPLLLFDQFEELFSYPEAQVLAFQQELAELRNTGIPLRFRRRLEADDAPELAEAEEDLLESALETRILFAIRSDRMHLLARLGDYLPNVLRHSCELKALTEEDARDAIILPAQSAAAGFATAPFAYSPAAVDRLLDFLRDKQDGRIEGILLQMLCEHYERKQVEAQQLSLLDLPQIGDPNEVVRNYYEEKISSLSEAQQSAARRLIEDGLVSDGEAMRLTLHEAYIAQEFRVNKALLETLVDSRLLRAEPFLRGGYTYELSHDRLVPAVLDARNLHREAKARDAAQRLKAEAEKAKRQLRMVQGLLVAAVLAVTLAVYFGYKSNVALADREKANTSTVELLLENTEQEILNLRYEDALERIKAAGSLNVAKSDVVDAYIEVAFWYSESGKVQRAMGILDTAALLIDSVIVSQKIHELSSNPSTDLFQVREVIKAIAPRRFEILYTGKYYPEMIKVSGGSFKMGCNQKIDPDCRREEKLHSQKVSDFKISKHEITVWQFALYCFANGLDINDFVISAWGKSGNNPVVNINWYHAVNYSNWVSEQKKVAKAISVDKTGTYLLNNQSNGFRLPTEAEWEYAAKKSTTSSSDFLFSGSNYLGEVGWYAYNSKDRIQPVGKKNPNTLGLYDMNGNVWEWCWDWFDQYLQYPPKDYAGPVKGTTRILRGGSWLNGSAYCRVSARGKSKPNTQSSYYGFRVAQGE